jgi:hypothetical protein
MSEVQEETVTETSPKERFNLKVAIAAAASSIIAVVTVIAISKKKSTDEEAGVISPPLDELYFTWLYSQVDSVEISNPSRTYWRMLRQLYTKEFVWSIPNDDNRAEDGKDLRREFINEEGLDDIDQAWLDLGCSMLELLIGLSRRLSFQDDGEPRSWFWQLIENLGLERYNDNALIREEEIYEILDEILNEVIRRTYKRNGSGGLFPLKRATEDQREVELWYQLSAYLLEKYYK